MRLGPLEIRKTRLGAGVRLGRFGLSWLNAEGRRNYLAADIARYSDKLRGGASLASADAIIQRDGRQLRKVGNYLVRNDPQAATMVRKRALRASGADGPGPRLQIPDGDRIEKLWRRWAKSCSLDRELSWGQVCNMLLRGEDAAGEALAYWTLDGGDLRLAPFEPDQLAPYWATARESQSIRDGIEYDPLTGQKLAYWFQAFDPGRPWAVLGATALVRLGAERVVHLYERERATQTRGVSLFAQVANAIADRREARAAHLQVGKIAAYMGVFIHTEGAANDFWGSLNQEDSDGTPSATDQDEVRLEPGSVNVLRPNERASFLNAKTPDLEFQAFDANIVREMAVHADLPAASLSGDYSSINYSSARMAARDNVMAEDYRRARFEAQVADRVFRAWLEAQALAGRVRMSPEQIEEAMDSLEWSWPARPYHDPLVEVRAAIAEVFVAKTRTWSGVVRANGGDPDELARQHAEDMALFEKYGLGPLFSAGAEAVAIGNTAPEDAQAASAGPGAPEQEINDGEDGSAPGDEEATA